MGTNLSLAEIKKIASGAVNAYREWQSKWDNSLPDYPSELLNEALANVLKELHLTGLAKDLLNEIKNVRGD